MAKAADDRPDRPTDPFRLILRPVEATNAGAAEPSRAPAPDLLLAACANAVQGTHEQLVGALDALLAACPEEGPFSILTPYGRTVSAMAYRAALELAALWDGERPDERVEGSAFTQPPGRAYFRLVCRGAIIAHDRQYEMERLYLAVRFPGQELPWTVLAPLARLPWLQPPSENAIALAPQIEAATKAAMSALDDLQTAMDRLWDLRWRCGEGMERPVEYADEAIMRAAFLEALSPVQVQLLRQEAERQLRAIEALQVGAKGRRVRNLPPKNRRGPLVAETVLPPTNLPKVREIQVAVALGLNTCLPDRRRYAGAAGRHGVFRLAVTARTAQIVRAAYGFHCTAEDVTNSLRAAPDLADLLGQTK
jgi:hypothetical protein